MNSSRTLGVALLALAVTTTTCAVARAQNQVDRAYYQKNQASSLQDTFDEVLASYQCGCNDAAYGCNECGDGYYGEPGCDCGYGYTDCGCYGGGGWWGGDCCTQYFVGADYLYVRANFSEAVAFVLEDRSDPLNNVFTINELEFDHESSYRLYAGIRDCCCGMEIRFDYTRFDSDAPGMTMASQTGIAGVTKVFPLEPPTGPDNTITVNGDVELDSYDLSCAKTIPLGSPLCGCCDCGDGCCDGCSDCCDCWCPAWDITWEAGIRAADVSWQQNVISELAATATAGSSSVAYNRMDFEGVGLRFGLGGRRYFGRRGLFSAFLNGDISLLVGDVDLVSSASVTTTGVTVNSTQTARFRNIIPVTEIEAGITGHLSQNISLSAGYLLSAWHDLGMRQQFSPSSLEAELGIAGYDDANILGFDGFFARLEAAY